MWYRESTNGSGCICGIKPALSSPVTNTAAHAVANVVMGLPLQPNPSKGLPFAVKHLPHWSKEQTLVPLQL